MTRYNRANEKINQATRAEFMTWVLHALPVAFDVLKHDIDISSNEWTTSADRVIHEEELVIHAFRIAHELDRQCIELFGERHAND
jgi:hypothetical protein